MPSASEQTDETLFERQTVLLNQMQQMHKEMREGFKSFGKALKGVFDDIKTPSPKLQLSSPSAPNAPSKTPITKNTSSSSIDYIPKSPTSSTSLSPNGYFNSPTSPPLRVSPPPPTQENASMDITLTLLPITPLDVQFNTPSPSPPIVGHPIPWNLLEAHGDSACVAISHRHPHTVYYSDFDESDEDESSEVEKSKINSLIREPSDAFLMRDKEIKFNPLEDIDDPVPILSVYEKPLDSLNCISDTFDTTINNPLFDFDSEFTLNYENLIFDIRYEDSDESKTETIMDEAHIHNSQNASQIPPLDVYLESEPEPEEYFIVEAYEKLITSGGKATFDMIMPSQFLTLSQFCYGLISVGHISGRDISGRDIPEITTNVEDEPLRVSTLVQKVTSLETELKAHKQLFKDMVGKLVKKVKAMEVKLKPKKRKVVVSDFDQEEGGEQAVDLDALIALANAAVTVDSNIPPGGPSNDPAASSHIPIDVPTDGDFAHAHATSLSRDPFKGKGVAKPSSPVSKRTKKQLADERLSETEAARLEALERERSEKEKADIARQDAIYAHQLEQEEEMSSSQRETRQAEVLSFAKHYSDADWIDIMAQVHANAGLSSKLLGVDVTDDNFAKRMVALINQRKRAFAE
ncbi:hypothetical protein Tco_0410092 [Tanacetum coccineum]